MSRQQELFQEHEDDNPSSGDPFGGSFKTAAAARKLWRKLITCEKALEYALGGLTRLGAEVPADSLAIA